MKNRGFTLIELLVVIAIIGILSSVVLASLRTARCRSGQLDSSKCEGIEVTPKVTSTSSIASKFDRTENTTLLEEKTDDCYGEIGCEEEKYKKIQECIERYQ